MSYRILVYSLVFVLLLAGSAAAIPGTPHQFFGDALINNAGAPDGTSIVALINGVDVASTTSLNGVYGQKPNIFYIEDPDGDRAGKNIDFYLDGVYVVSYTFTNGQSTELDLSIIISSPAPLSDGGGSGIGGGYYCVSEWECTDWSACAAGEQTRTCTDVECGRTTASNKPAETQTCSVSVAVPTGTCVNGQTVCAGDNLYICYNNEWELSEECEYGCDDTEIGEASCISQPGDSGDDGDAGPPGPPTGAFLDPASLAAIIAAVVVIVVAAAAWKIKSGKPDSTAGSLE